MTQEDHSVTGGLISVGTMTLLTVILGYVNVRWPRLGRFVHGSPVVILHGENPDLKALHSERMGITALMTAAPGQGFRNFSDIYLAVLELNGKISFLAKDGGSSSTQAEGAGQGSLPETAQTDPDPAPLILPLDQ